MCRQLERQLQTLGTRVLVKFPESRKGWEHKHGMTGGLLGYEMAAAFKNGGRLRCSGNGRVERQSRRPRRPKYACGLVALVGGSDRGFSGLKP